MSNARIQFSTASEEKWTQVNPTLREGELVIVKKASGKRKLVVGNAGGSTYSASEVVWDAELAEGYATQAAAGATSASSQATAAAASATSAASAATSAAGSASAAATSAASAKTYMEQAKSIADFSLTVTDDGNGNVYMKF